MLTVKDIKSWPQKNGWSVNPEKGNWVSLGDGVSLGNRVSLGDGVSLGNWVSLGDGVSLGNWVSLGDGVSLGNNIKVPDGLNGLSFRFLASPATVSGQHIFVGCMVKTITDWLALTYKEAQTLGRTTPEIFNVYHSFFEFVADIIKARGEGDGK